MQAAEKINAGQPRPYTGRAAPPTTVRADNDDAITAAFLALPEFVFQAVMGYRLRQRQANIRYDARKTQGRAAELSLKPVATSRDVEAKLTQAAEARSKAGALRDADARKNRQAIKDHETAAKLLENEARDLQRQAADDDWSRRTDEETTALAKGRGEAVEKTKAGRTRIMTRMGIQHAYEAGYMTPPDGKRLSSAHLHETARRYRDAYEIAAGRTTPSGSDGSGGGKGPQVRLIEAAQELATMRIGLTKLEAEVLDRVCGQEMRAREAAVVLRRGFGKVHEALRFGLTTATENLRAARAAKDTEETLTIRQRLTWADEKFRAAERSVA